MAQSQKAPEDQGNASDTFEVSSFAKLLRENHPKTSVTAGITVLGEIDNLW